MKNKKGFSTLLVIAIILIIFVIILMIVDLLLENKSNNTANSTSNSALANTTSKVSPNENTTKKSEKTDTTDTIEKNDEENDEDEEVKKIDESKEKIYEKEVSIDSRTLQVPVINLTTKDVTKINSEVESKYKDSSSNGYYIVYYYYMYVGMISLILDYRYTSGAHQYEVYNVNSETGKQMTNEDLLSKLKVSKDDFVSKAKTAYKAKFEEIFKDVDKNSSAYQKALEATLKNAEDALSSAMFINLKAQFACYAKLVNFASGNYEYYLVEFN